MKIMWWTAIAIIFGSATWLHVRDRHQAAIMQQSCGKTVEGIYFYCQGSPPAEGVAFRDLRNYQPEAAQ